MRCLTIIMMFNPYPIKKLTTINNARTIFLMELKEKTFIDISSHIFDTIVDETRTTSRPKLIFSSPLMRIFRKKGVVIPRDISPMSTPSAINKQTFKRISFVFQVKKMKVMKERVFQWRLRQRQQIKHQLQHPEGVARGLEHQLLQIYLQMHFRSFWKDLMESERSRPSSLRG